MSRILSMENAIFTKQREMLTPATSPGIQETWSRVKCTVYMYVPVYVCVWGIRKHTRKYICVRLMNKQFWEIKCTKLLNQKLSRRTIWSIPFEFQLEIENWCIRKLSEKVKQQKWRSTSIRSYCPWRRITFYLMPVNINYNFYLQL